MDNKKNIKYVYCACGERNIYGQKYCKSCWREIDDIKPVKKVKIDERLNRTNVREYVYCTCGAKNDADNVYCDVCGIPLKKTMLYRTTPQKIDLNKAKNISEIDPQIQTETYKYKCPKCGYKEAVYEIEKYEYVDPQKLREYYRSLCNINPNYIHVIEIRTREVYRCLHCGYKDYR